MENRLALKRHWISVLAGLGTGLAARHFFRIFIAITLHEGAMSGRYQEAKGAGLAPTNGAISGSYLLRAQPQGGAGFLGLNGTYLS